MENINNKDARTARLPKGKPPTRLQKRAPAALQLDDISSSNQIQSASSIITKTESFSRNAIPLLSPLILSPSPLLPPQPEIESIIVSCNNNQVQAVNTTGAPAGWQHPAVTGTLPEASNLFALFQSQCTLVQQSQ